MIPDLEIILRLGIAAVLGMLVGFERERQSQPAGLRTHTILAIGSCLAMTVSINMAFQFTSYTGDPSRLAAQVVSGIGFLGAGAILRYGINVKGLTTATSLWTIAIVGLAIGAGQYIAGFATTTMLLIILVLLNVLEHKLIKSYENITVSVTGINNPHLVEDLLALFKSMKKMVRSVSVEADLPHDTQIVTIMLKAIETDPMEDIREGLKSVAGVTHYKLN